MEAQQAMDRQELARRLEDISQRSLNKIADFHQELTAALLQRADAVSERALRDMVEKSVDDVAHKSVQNGCFDIERAMKALLTVVTGAALLEMMKKEQRGDEEDTDTIEENIRQ